MGTTQRERQLLMGIRDREASDGSNKNEIWRMKVMAYKIKKTRLKRMKQSAGIVWIVIEE